MLSLDDIQRALGRHQPEVGGFQPVRNHAAVALILAGEEADLRLCFIRRAERAGDPWSGHYAFPGGRAHPEDPTARAVAERETREEVDLTLENGHLVAPLSRMPVRLGGVDIGMVLFSFVYYVGREIPALTPSGEVSAAHWVPLSHLWDEVNATHMELENSRMVYPAIHFLDYVIWGLTYRVLTLFSDVLDHPLPHFEEFPGLGR